MAFDLLFEDREVIAAGAHNPVARRRKIKLVDLMAESWVLPPADNVIGSVASESFRACGLEYPKAVVVCDSPHGRIGLLSSQHFLSIFPISGLKFPAPRLDIRILPVDLPLSRMPVGILTLKNRTLSPVARLFVKEAHKVAKSLK